MALTQCQIDAIAGEALAWRVGRRAVLPMEVYDYLKNDYLKDLKDIGTRFPDVNPNEVGVVFAMGVYGPTKELGPPAEALVHLLADGVLLGDRLELRAVEHVLVWGLVQPWAASAAWDRCWGSETIDVLVDLIEAIIRPHVQWVARNVANLPKGKFLDDYVGRELPSCARLLGESMVRWENGKPEIAAWPETGIPLANWLEQQIVVMPPHIVDGFRRGRLFLVLKDPNNESLEAGEVLVCRRGKCRGEIQLDDRCEKCEKMWLKPSGPGISATERCPDRLRQQPALRLFFSGQRERATCKLCRFCGGKFFRYAHREPLPCPACARLDWSPRETKTVFVRTPYTVREGDENRGEQSGDGSNGQFCLQQVSLDGGEERELFDDIKGLRESDEFWECLETSSRRIPQPLRVLIRQFADRPSPKNDQRFVDQLRKMYSDNRESDIPEEFDDLMRELAPQLSAKDQQHLINLIRSLFSENDDNDFDDRLENLMREWDVRFSAEDQQRLINLIRKPHSEDERESD